MLTSNLNTNFFKLIENYTSQKNQVYCGIASAVIILNSLETIPDSLLFDKYYFFTQENVFLSDFKNKKFMDEIYKHGITLDKLGEMLKEKKVDVIIKHASSKGYFNFIHDIENTLHHQNFIIVNFFRPKINQEGGGHFSPIAAYNKNKNSVLILDVARYKQKPFWINADRLWKSMNTLDKRAHKSRGYLIIKGVPHEK
ncbi:hypothetical protein A8135_06475 [Legionella jamestowniensis]|uniref:glutathione gamma-glutamylcysteinyltransferase n=1 Tax=Legionella jamestowniensis TaxID=455 RepID=A0A0W0UGL6_9GAMM|nr:Phytochelatin synthase [Legionella jamestowniensis]OCH96798.1 hypothetical protein A8135_06475 [Legionella jamestowniensis]SFM04386.1 Phytochelatin synthase [Legionella jamestowniensis DSM 19215]